MINQKFEKVISLLRSVEPDRDFVARSKRLILATAQEPRQRFSLSFLEGVTVQTAFAYASIIMVMFVGGVTYLKSTPAHLSQSLNDDVLVQEVRSASFEIQIAEARYYDESADAVALALEKLAGEQNHEIIE